MLLTSQLSLSPTALLHWRYSLLGEHNVVKNSAVSLCSSSALLEIQLGEHNVVKNSAVTVSGAALLHWRSSLLGEQYCYSHLSL